MKGRILICVLICVFSWITSFYFAFMPLPMGPRLGCRVSGLVSKDVDLFPLQSHDFGTVKENRVKWMDLEFKLR